MKISKTQAKEKIKKLVEKFEKLSPSEFKKINEADTRRLFILPLFHALGWDVYGDFITNEVAEEETSVSGRIDYSFRINSVIQFLLEAKAIPEDLDKEKWAHQAVEYGWNKGIPWVVLTDFEGLKVFNSEWKVDRPKANLIFSYKDYLEKFDRLWLLSKEAFEKNELDKLLSEFGITAKRVSVNEKLAEDLVDWRNFLTKNLKLWNEKISGEEIEEAVQRILDRLIFIRVVEDRDIEEKVLWQAFQKWQSNHFQPNNFIELLISLFRRFDEKYNSNLFQKHLCESLVTEGDPFRKIIPQLYGEKEEGVKYRFDAIDADVLGEVYEQYLGSVQRREGEKSKRKKQGIYYTPTYIVDYIVQNTVGKLLEEKTSLLEKENIKVLDPACGSGSFLIKSFEVIDEHLKNLRDKDNKNPIQTALRKYRVLTENIYGVDLDEQAIEIARLNLLLKALVPEQRLPLLTKHMKIGNSLISDEKIAKKAFSWKKEFPEIFKGDNPGFDVIIGNPPYISFYSRESLLDHYRDELKWLITNYTFTQKYQDRRLNIVMFFLERSLNLLKAGGYLGFILDANFIEKPFCAIRKFIDDGDISIKISKKISVFEDVSSDQIIVVLQKQRSKNRKSINVIDYNSNKKQFFALDETLDRSEFRSDVLNLNINRIVLNVGQKLFHIADISTGVQIGIGGTRKYKGKKIADLFYREKQNLGFYKNVSLHSKDFFKYSPIQIKNYINLDEKLAYEINKLVPKCNIAVTKAEGFKNENKIFIRQSADRIVATLGYKGQVCEYSAFMLKTKIPSDLKYVLALLNSKLLSFYALQENIILTGSKKQPQIRIKGLKLLPVPIEASGKQKRTFSAFVTQTIDLNKKLQSIAKNTDKWHKLKKQAEKVILKIDQLVYKLYGLTPEEIKIVEKEN